MRIMGLDYGDKKIGIAVSDELGWTGQGLEVLVRRSSEHDLERLREIIKQYEISEIVVGLPKNMNATIGSRGEICLEFARTLQQILNMPVHMWDERLTTVSANRTLIEGDVSRKKRKMVVDKLAASLILQGFLDNRSSKG